MALSKEERVELDLSPLDFFFLCMLKGEVVLNKNQSPALLFCSVCFCFFLLFCRI